MPRETKTIVAFFLRMSLIYGVLVLPWSGWREGYMGFFRSTGSVALSSWGSGGSVRFDPRTEPGKPWSTRLIFKSTRTNVTGDVFFEARQGYLATALIFALVLATPVPWSRRCKALMWGMLLINAFVFFRTGLTITHLFSDGSQHAVIELSQFWKEALGLAVKTLNRSPEFTYVMPLFIWIVVTLRKSDFEKWRNGVGLSPR